MSGPVSSPPKAAELRAEIDRAMRLARSGNTDEAERAFREILARHPDCVEAHSFLGTLAFRRGHYEEALAACRKSVALEPRNFSLHLNLGMAKEKTGDLNGAIADYLTAFRLNPRDARTALFAGAALEDAGRREEAAVMFTFGDDVSSAVRTARTNPNAAPELRERSATADRVIREHFTRLHALSLDEAESRLREEAGGADVDLSRIRGAVWVKTHDGPVEYRTPRQAPSLFYVPDLEPIHIVPHERLPWAGDVEAAAGAIRAEYLAAVEGGAPMTPYVRAGMQDPAWRKLSGTLDWSSLHLYRGGEPTSVAGRFPRTIEALQTADLVRVGSGNPIEVFFSRLRPGAHIPPHVGEANNRLTVHLPLIVPPDCAIRVKSDVHAWREGELFAFDDSFEHEAWNDSDTDRIVLIFEAHHPDLRPEERKAIEHVFNVRRQWLADRQAPEAVECENKA